MTSPAFHDGDLRREPKGDALVREWLRLEMQRRYGDALATPLPDRIAQLLPAE
ncbi:MAG: hypothetical protein JO157_13195 [Acetobacteraceae bacterium]|nr:hypothetical protein [Acetobacteraceae bacterium]